MTKRPSGRRSILDRARILKKRFFVRDMKLDTAVELPADLVVLVSAADFMDRGPVDPVGEPGKRRVLVLFAYGKGFNYSHEAATSWLRSRWPSLNDQQMVNAIRLFESRRRMVEREAMRTEYEASRGRRDEWRPLGGLGR